MAETTFYADQDCCFDSEADSAGENTNELGIGFTPLTVIYRALVRFNLSSISSHTIDGATLQLTKSTSSFDAAGTVVVARVTRSWTESANRVNYDGSNPWTTVGGDYSLSGAVALGFDGTQSTISLSGRNFTTLVQNCVATDSGYVNLIIGLLLGTSDPYNAGFSVWSSEYTTQASRPKLVITSASGERVADRDSRIAPAATVAGVGIVNASVFADPPSKFSAALGGSFDVG